MNLTRPDRSGIMSPMINDNEEELEDDECEDDEREDDEEDLDEDEGGEEQSASEAPISRAEHLEQVYREAADLIETWPGPVAVVAGPTAKRSKSASLGIDVYFVSAKIPQDVVTIAAHGMACQLQGPIAAMAARLQITLEEAEDIESGWHGLPGEGPLHAIGFRLRSLRRAPREEPAQDFDLAGMQQEQGPAITAILCDEAREIAQERIDSQRRREEWQAEARARRAASDAAKRARKEAKQAEVSA